MSTGTVHLHLAVGLHRTACSCGRGAVGAPSARRRGCSHSSQLTAGTSHTPRAVGLSGQGAKSVRRLLGVAVWGPREVDSEMVDVGCSQDPHIWGRRGDEVGRGDPRL